MGQAQFGMIEAERGVLHACEPAVALEQRPDARVGERIGIALWRVAAEAAARPYR